MFLGCETFLELIPDVILTQKHHVNVCQIISSPTEQWMFLKNDLHLTKLFPTMIFIFYQEIFTIYFQL
jgi:hypothetical protein